MKCGDTVDPLIDANYPHISALPLPEDQFFLDWTILYALNEEVNAINEKVLQKFPGEEFISLSADKLCLEEGVDAAGQANMYLIEYLNSITHSGLPPSKLALKKGCPLMLLRNLDSQKGLCNGTRCILTNFTSNVLEVHILGGNIEEADRTAFIPRITLFGPEEELGFKFS